MDEKEKLPESKTQRLAEAEEFDKIEKELREKLRRTGLKY
jgi:hypothetical protein